MADKLDRLQQLARLLESGQITQAEFESLKSEVLGAGASESANPDEQRPLGWYPVQNGGADYEAFWDGDVWTGATRRRVVAPTVAPKLSKREIGRGLIWLLMIFVGFIAVAGMTGESNSPDQATTGARVSTTTTRPAASSLSEQECRDLAVLFDSYAAMSDLAAERGDQEKLREAGDGMESTIAQIEGGCMSYPGFN
jgi:hypothetical protein